MLNRSITRWEMVLLIINGVIGAGIFGLPAKAFKDAGVYSLLALLVCAIAVFVIVFCFAEVASRFSKTGGPYLYTRTALGAWPGFLTGWLLLLTRFITYAALINLLVTYLTVFSPWFATSMGRYSCIIGVTAALTWFNYTGVRRTTTLNNIFTITKLSALLLFILIGTMYIDTSNFLVETRPDFSGFSSTVLLLVFAFGGFESVLVNTGEVQQPQRNLPFALLNATIIIAFIYMLILVVCIGTLPTLADSERPLAEAAAGMVGAPGAIFITVGAVASVVGTLNAIMLAGSRLPFAFAEEKHLPSWFGFVHPQYHTPVRSLLVYSVVTVLISLSYNFISAASISAITRVMIYFMVCIALIVLRKKSFSSVGAFTLRHGTLFAVLGITVSLWLISSSTIPELRDIALAMAVGAVIFAAYQFAKRSNKTP